MIGSADPYLYKRAAPPAQASRLKPERSDEGGGSISKDRPRFARYREMLDARESEQAGRNVHVSDQQIAWALGISTGTVSRLMLREDRLTQPVFVLALQYCIDVGIEEADTGLVDVELEEIQQLVKDIKLPARELRIMCGMSRQSWHRTLTGEQPPRRVVLMALRHLMTEYGPGTRHAERLAHGFAWRKN